MKIVNHIIEVKLSFRGYYLSSGTENNNTFLVASSYGQVTIFNQQGTIRNSLNLAVAIEAIDFDY